MPCNSSCGNVVGLAQGFDDRIGYDVDLGYGCYCVGLEIGVLVKGSSSSLGGKCRRRETAPESSVERGTRDFG